MPIEICRKANIRPRSFICFAFADVKRKTHTKKFQAVHYNSCLADIGDFDKKILCVRKFSNLPNLEIWVTDEV